MTERLPYQVAVPCYISLKLIMASVVDSKDTLCRNVLIYGHCRYEDQGCAFNHDQNKNSNNSIDK